MVAASSTSSSSTIFYSWDHPLQAQRYNESSTPLLPSPFFDPPDYDHYISAEKVEKKIIQRASVVKSSEDRSNEKKFKQRI
jgi:hypothetical protein